MPVAQLDRAFDYESKGREFESLRARHAFHAQGRSSAICGCSSMVELQPSKLRARVRFPPPAPTKRDIHQGRAAHAWFVSSQLLRACDTVGISRFCFLQEFVKLGKVLAPRDVNKGEGGYNEGMLLVGGEGGD